MDEADSGLWTNPKFHNFLIIELDNFNTLLKIFLGGNFVSGTTCVVGDGGYKKWMPDCNGLWIRVQTLPWPERVLTCSWFFTANRMNFNERDKINYGTLRGHFGQRTCKKWKKIPIKRQEIFVTRLQTYIAKAVKDVQYRLEQKSIRMFLHYAHKSG